MKRPHAFIPVLIITMIFIATLDISFGVVGYIGSPDEISELITDSLPNGLLRILTEIALAFALLITYPLQMWPVIETIEKTMTNIAHNIWKSKLIPLVSKKKDRKKIYGSLSEEDDKSDKIHSLNGENDDSTQGQDQEMSNPGEYITPLMLADDADYGSSDDRSRGSENSERKFTDVTEKNHIKQQSSGEDIHQPEEGTFKVLPPDKQIILLLSKYAMRSSLVILSYFVGIGIPNFNLLISLIGAVCSTPLAYIFPTLMHMKMLWLQRKDAIRRKVPFFNPITIVLATVDIIIFSFGILVAVFGTATTFVSILREVFKVPIPRY